MLVSVADNLLRPWSWGRCFACRVPLSHDYVYDTRYDALYRAWCSWTCHRESQP